MAKNVCDFIKDQADIQPPSKIQELSLDEITEVGIYDAVSKQQRKELLAKKTRRVFKGSKITLRMLFKNTLNVELSVKNIRIICSLTAD
mmetsp:Transcript_41884/g.64103  ORF Transcript_41884/g.64103 Transcript_41884/m.64103 type:complete len:89 (-) Transcript_41884:1571-1837(-)